MAVKDRYPILEKFYFNTQPLWDELPKEICSNFKAHNQTLKFNKGETILFEDSNPLGVYKIVSGYLKVFTTNNKGDEEIIYILGKNHIFGVASLLSGETTRSIVYAITDCEIELTPKDPFFDQLKTSLELNSALLKYLAQVGRVLNSKLTTFARKPLNERVALALLLLDQKLDLDGTIIFSREDLANYIGTAVESLVRQLKKMKEDRLIKVQGRKIILLDYDKIYQMANDTTI